MPRSLPSAISHSPVCTPARISIPTSASAAAGGDRDTGSLRTLTVERREEAVAGGVDLTATEAIELRPHPGVVMVEKVAPAPVAEVEATAQGGVERTSLIAGEDHTVASTQSGLDRPAHSCEELADLGHDLVAAGTERDVILAIELDVPGAGDVPSDVAAVLDR